jgi:dolichol-phosphate mannosyltransferase
MAPRSGGKFHSSNLPRLKQFIQFICVGGSGVIVNTGLLHVLTVAGKLDYRLSSLFAIECAIINNFFWNYRWTFSERKPDSRRRIPKIFLKFNVSSGLVAFVANWGMLVLLTEFLHMHYLMSNLIGIGFGTGANFLISHFWTFKPKPVTQKA